MIFSSLLSGQMRETFTIERLVGGAMKITSDSPWLPGGVMVIKSGESYNLEIPGLGMTSVSSRYHSTSFYTTNKLK